MVYGACDNFNKGGFRMQIENDVEKYLIKAVKQHHGFCLKFVSPGNAGVPDRLIIWPDGRMVFAELKRDAKHQPRPLQLNWHRRLRRKHVKVYVLHTKGEVDEFIKGMIS